MANKLTSKEIQSAMEAVGDIHGSGGIGMSGVARNKDPLAKAIAKEFDIFMNTHLRGEFVDDLHDVLSGNQKVMTVDWDDNVRKLNKNQGVRELVKSFAGAENKGIAGEASAYFDAPLHKGSPYSTNQVDRKVRKYEDGRKLFRFQRPEVDADGFTKHTIGPLSNNPNMNRKFAAEMLQRIRKMGKAGLIPMMLLSLLGPQLFGDSKDE